jgi:hypothetical protein
MTPSEGATIIASMNRLLGRRELVVAALLVACFAAGVVHSLLRTPIQVSDSLEAILRASHSTSPVSAFVEGLGLSSMTLRPMRYAGAKVLLDLGDALGGRYDVAFRGFHALLAVALFALFAVALRVRTCADLVVLPLVLTIFVGLHTFAGMMREAYPINHFLQVVVCALVVLVAAQSRGGWLADVIAVTSLAGALFTLDSGVLVWLVAVAARSWGWRGISRSGLSVMTLLTLAIVGFRVGYLHLSTTGIGEHATGFGSVMLESNDQIRRFGAHPIPFYAYNVVSSIATVLFSEPRVGVWAAAVLANGRVPPPSIFVEIATSTGATAVLVWALIRLRRGRLEDDGLRRIALVAAVMLVANAAISYAYTKDEIVSLSGTFYVLAVGAALREAVLALSRLPGGARRTAAVCAFAALSLLWAWRAVGFEYKMRRSASDKRAEWASALPPGTHDSWPNDPRQVNLALALKQQALNLRTTSYRLLPHWLERWCGE